MSEFKGKTIAEAKQRAQGSFALPLKDLSIVVKQQPRRGFLGIGRRLAIIEVKRKNIADNQPKIKKTTPHLPPVLHQSTADGNQSMEKQVVSKDEEDDPAVIKARHAANLKRVRTAGQQLNKYLSEVLNQLGIQAHPVIKEVTAHELKVDVKTHQSGRLIGRHGRQINALEQLSVAFMNYHGAPKTAVILDTSDYRKRRRETLHELAQKAGMEVVATGQAVFLDPMPARERKQLHKELEKNPHVKTYSHGREPYRSVVVAPQN